MCQRKVEEKQQRFYVHLIRKEKKYITRHIINYPYCKVRNHFGLLTKIGSQRMYSRRPFINNTTAHRSLTLPISENAHLAYDTKLNLPTRNSL